MKPHLQTTIRTLLEAGASQREIERVTRIDRKTIRAYQQRFAREAEANSPGVATDLAQAAALTWEQIPPPRPPTSPPATTSACEPHRAFEIALARR